MTTTTDPLDLDRLVNELFREFEEMRKQRSEQDDWWQNYHQKQKAYYEELAQERKEREKERKKELAALERETRLYPWVACSIILFAIVSLIAKHFF